MRAIVTAKLPRNPQHDPKYKRSGKCPIGDEYCTDVTGSHRCYIEVGKNFDDIWGKAHGRHQHITRIETLHTDPLESKLEAVVKFINNWRSLTDDGQKIIKNIREILAETA